MQDKMTEILILLLLPDEQAELFTGRKALVTPLSHKELIRLRTLLDEVAKFMGFNLRCLLTLQELREGNENRSDQIAKTLEMMVKPSRDMIEIIKEIRELLDRSFVAGEDHPVAKLIARKGPMQ